MITNILTRLGFVRPDGTIDRFVTGMAFLVAVVVVFFWWILSPPITYHNSPFPFEKDVYIDGEEMRIDVTQTRHTAAPLNLISRQHVCDGEIELSQTEGPLGGGSSGYSENNLPLFWPEGHAGNKCFARLKFVAECVGPFCRVSEAETQVITILPRE